MPEEKRVSLKQPAAEAAEQIAYESVPLPTGGAIYPPESPLHMQGAIEIRSMTARDEDILTSKALLRNGKAVSMLLRNCIVSKGVDVDQMVVGDRNAALIGIRITGYGPDYQVVISCPSCGEKVPRTVDLSQLPIKRFPKGAAPVQDGVNEFSHKTIAGRHVRFRLITGTDEREMIQTVERARKAGTPEELVTTRLRLQVSAIDGETDAGKLAQLIRNMPARESRELRAHMDDVSPGVQMTVPFECPGCDYSQEVEVPLGTEFFWPQGGR